MSLQDFVPTPRLEGYSEAFKDFFRMERRERVERSNAGFAIQPLTVCCCGAGDQQFGGPIQLTPGNQASGSDQ